MVRGEEGKGSAYMWKKCCISRIPQMLVAVVVASSTRYSLLLRTRRPAKSTVVEIFTGCQIPYVAVFLYPTLSLSS